MFNVRCSQCPMFPHRRRPSPLTASGSPDETRHERTFIHPKHSDMPVGEYRLLGKEITMKTPALALMILCFGIFLAGAEPKAPATVTKKGEPTFLSKAEVTKLLSDRFAAKKTAVFSSRDGKSYGMDSDSVVSLEPEGKAVVGEYGYSYQGCRGTYAVGEDGAISIALKGYRGKWPEMKMAKENNLIRLYAKDGDGNFVFGGRAGAVETEKMKPFWPFRLVETNSTPEVTPIWSGGDLKSFSSPTLPDGFEWQGDRIRFRLDFTLSTNGIPSIEKYWTQDGSSGQYAGDDWRLEAVESAKSALRSWRFYPHKSDDDPVPMGRGWNFTLSKVGDVAHWKIEDESVTIFDNMPRESNK